MGPAATTDQLSAVRATPGSTAASAGQENAEAPSQRGNGASVLGKDAIRTYTSGARSALVR